MTIADAFVHKTELEMAAAPFEGYAGSPLTTDTETSPPSDTTPAMPILDDVTKRSRSLLRSVGSRPLSDDMEKYFQAEGTVENLNSKLSPMISLGYLVEAVEPHTHTYFTPLSCLS